jgi:hypothetical protein
LKLAPRAEVLLLTSPHAPEEARRNLEAKRPEALDCLQRIREQARMVPEAPMALVRKAPAEGLPLKNAPIPAAAWSAGAEAPAGVMDLLEGKG